MRLLALVLVAGALSAGCATALEPRLGTAPVKGFDLVDLSRVDETRYRADYEACAQVANQDLVDVGRTTAGLVGAAAEKASLGIVGGKPAKHADRMTVLKRCLTGRGYQVLR